MATASDALPNIWQIYPADEKNKLATNITRTSSHKLKMPPKELIAPIKLDAVLKEKYAKETGQ